MNDRTIARALVCRLIDQAMKKYGMQRPLTDEHLTKVARYIVALLTSVEVRAMYDENAFHAIDVESNDLYGVYTERLAERYVGVRLEKHVCRKDPLTEEHLRELLGDFQDLVWNGYGDDAIQVD